jgi:ferrous iron transport protein A
MTTRSLSRLKPSEKGIILRVGGNGPIRRRILEMGVVAGSQVEVEYIAPLGDPIAIKVKGYHLSLRKEEADGIEVHVSDNGEDAVPLGVVPLGEWVRVLGVAGGRGVTQGLSDAGIVAGVELGVVERRSGGHMVVDVGGRLVPLGAGMAEKVLVVRR